VDSGRRRGEDDEHVVLKSPLHNRQTSGEEAKRQVTSNTCNAGTRKGSSRQDTRYGRSDGNRQLGAGRGRQPSSNSVQIYLSKNSLSAWLLPILLCVDGM
jgi:hypothetical protein